MTKRELAPDGGRLRSYLLAPGERIELAQHPHGHVVAVLSGWLELSLPDAEHNRMPLYSTGEVITVEPGHRHAWKAGPTGCAFWCYSWTPE